MIAESGGDGREMTVTATRAHRPSPQGAHAVGSGNRSPGGSRWGKAALIAAVIVTLVVGITDAVAQSGRPELAQQLAGNGEVAIWGGSVSPKAPADSDTKSVELGTQFTTKAPGVVTAILFFKHSSNTGRHDGSLWDSSGRRLANVRFENETRRGWQQARLTKPVRLSVNTSYVVSYHAPRGRYADDTEYFDSGSNQVNGPLTATAGVYAYGNESLYPTDIWRASNYYVDIAFLPDQPGVVSETTAPAPTPTLSSAPSPSPTLGSPTNVPSSAPPTTSAPATPSVSRPPLTPTQAGGPVYGGACVASPSACGYPDASNTGVQANRSLTDHRGNYRVTEAGSVVSDLRIYGSLYIEADDVIVRNVEVICSQSWWIIRDQGRRTTIEDVTLTVDRSNSSNYCQYGIAGGDAVTIQRADISYTPNGLIFNGGSATVKNNWIHDQRAYPGRDDHVDAAQLNGGGPGPYVFVNNHLSVPEAQTGCLALFADFGSIRNVVVDRNLFDGAGYSFYGGTDSATNVRVTNNVFGKTYFPRGGHFGPVAHFNARGDGNVWLNNVWLDTGAPVNAG